MPDLDETSLYLETNCQRQILWAIRFFSEIVCVYIYIKF